MTTYFVYILECVDKSLYTGITTDLERRWLEHNGKGKGAKYTSAHKPVKYIYTKKFSGRSKASIEEARIKKLSREDKLSLISKIGTDKY